jgi:hypothetical protein
VPVLGRSLKKIVASTHYISLALLALVALSIRGLAEESPITPGELTAELKRVEALPNEKKIETLGDLLLSLRQPSPDRDEKFTVGAFARVQKQLLQIPGHAIHFAFQIRKLRTEALTSLDKYPLYEAYAVRAFGVLELLPSVETVEIAASFLDESWNPPLATDAGCPSVNAHRVLRALLQDPPKTERPFDVPTWLSWREAVRAGEATFMLKGLDAELNFTEPTGNKSREQDGAEQAPTVPESK